MNDSIKCIINYAYLESDYFKSLLQKDSDRFTGALIIDDAHESMVSHYSEDHIKDTVNKAVFTMVMSLYKNESKPIYECEIKFMNTAFQVCAIQET